MADKVIQNPIFFRHKLIERFSVGVFNFSNHLLQIDESDREAFMNEWDGLQGVDQVNIVEVMNIQNERPVDSRTVIRGPSGTDNSRVGLTGADRATSLAAREEELANRERELEAEIAAFAAMRQNPTVDSGAMLKTDADRDGTNSTLASAGLTGSAADGLGASRNDADIQVGLDRPDAAVTDNSGATAPLERIEPPILQPAPPTPGVDETKVIEATTKPTPPAATAPAEAPPGLKLGGGIKLNNQ